MVLEAIQHFFFEKSWLVVVLCVGSVRWSAQVDDVGNIPFGQNASTGDKSNPNGGTDSARILLKGTTSLPA